MRNNKMNKRSLYESIMSRIAKEVKHTLNEVSDETLIRASQKSRDYADRYKDDPMTSHMWNKRANNFDNYRNRMNGPKKVVATDLTIRKIIRDEVEKQVASKNYDIDLNFIDTTYVTDMSNLFYGSYGSAFDYVKTLDISSWDTSNVTTMDSMFYGCDSLIHIEGIENFDTSNVTDMNSMFEECESIESLDISGWDVSNVEGMKDMFFNCKSLRILDISRWDTFNVTDMSNMFARCRKLSTIDISNLDTRNVSNMKGMFYGCDAEVIK